METTLIILAGGEGRRIGRPKLWIRLYGIPMYMFSLKAPVRKVFVTRENMLPPLPPDVEVVIDPGRGPAEALKLALKRVDTERVAIRPIDMPCLTRERYEEHIGEGIVVFSSDRIHRIASIWPRKELHVGKRIRDAFVGKRFKIVRLNECEGLNVNTLEDLFSCLECLKQGYGSIRPPAEGEPEVDLI